MAKQPRRITVIDDSPELLGLFGDVLRADGVELSLLDESATIQDVAASAPGLLVIDLLLGDDGLSGMDMVRLVRSHRELREVPIIVCSAALHEIREHDEELSRTSAIFVLAKPFSLEELESRVREALDQRVRPPKEVEPLSVSQARTGEFAAPAPD